MKGVGQTLTAVKKFESEAKTLGANVHAEPVTMREHIGSTVYEVRIHFNPDAKETMGEKILRLVKNDLNFGQENVTMTLHLQHEEGIPQCYVGYSINGGDIIPPVENEDVTFNLMLQPDDTVFVLKCYWDEHTSDTFTFKIKRYGCSTSGYMLNLANYNEIATGGSPLTFTDPVTNSEIKIYLIDKCQLEYEYIVGNFSGNLPLHFKETNGSRVSDANVGVNAYSIYKINLDVGIIYGQVNPPSAQTHMDYAGRPSYTTMDYGGYFVVRINYNTSGQITETSVNYNRHSNDVVVSANSEILSTYDINHPGSISNMTVSNLTFIENFCSENNIELFGTSNISIYPNPANDFLIINGLTDEILHFYTVTGQLLFTYKIIDKTEKITISHLPAGVYFVKTSNERIFKIIKE
jgi:hypothetical protein